jgi:hypothetical protein
MVPFYHPNRANKGFAASFWHSERDDTIFATILKQSGWDEATQNGLFKQSVDDPNMKVNVKLDYTECAAILDCIERGREFKTYHDFGDFPKQISFTHWTPKDREGVVAHKGYSFSITVTSKQDSTFKNSFYIALTFPEARLLREFIIYSLHAHFARLRNNKSARTVTQAAPAQELEV